MAACVVVVLEVEAADESRMVVVCAVSCCLFVAVVEVEVAVERNVPTSDDSNAPTSAATAGVREV